MSMPPAAMDAPPPPPARRTCRMDAMKVTGSLLGVAVAAALLAIVAVATPPDPLPDRPDLMPTRPSVQARFASALRSLGQEPRTATYEAGVVTATMELVRSSELPRLRVDASIAASRVRSSCRCDLAGYRVLGDGQGANRKLLVAGVARRVRDRSIDLDDTVWRMNTASPAEISRRARGLVSVAASSGAARLTITILREGHPVFVFAMRPASGEAWIWTTPGITAPPLPRQRSPGEPQTPFTQSF